MRNEGFEPIIHQRHPHGNRVQRRAAMSTQGGDSWKQRQRGWGERNARRRMARLGRVTLRTSSFVDLTACRLNTHGRIPLPPPGSNVAIGAQKIPLPVHPLAREQAEARASYTHPSHTNAAKRVKQARG